MRAVSSASDVPSVTFSGQQPLHSSDILSFIAVPPLLKIIFKSLPPARKLRAYGRAVHAERGGDIAEMLKSHLLDFARRSRQAEADPPVDVLLADTTGAMLKLMNGADIVIMGKSLAGHDEGHNLIEPALLDKPIVTGHVLRNFRFILNVLLQENAVATVTHDSELEEQLRKLLVNKELREELGKRAGRTIRKHAGATERTVNELESLLKK